MKIAMIGSGAAGSVFAAYLKMGGADMYLVDKYKAHMDAIATDGLSFTEFGEEKRLTGFTCAEDAAEIGVMDYVIIMVKATQTESIMPSVMKCLDGHTVVVSLQNGLDNDYTLKNYVPEDRILCGFGQIGTELSAPGVCVARPESGVVMRFGPVRETEYLREAGLKLEECFVKGGCQTRYEPEIMRFIWKKTIANSGYNTVSALMGLKVGEVLADDSGRELVLKVWKEACDVAAALGVGELHQEMEEELPRLQGALRIIIPPWLRIFLSIVRPRYCISTARSAAMASLWACLPR